MSRLGYRNSTVLLAGAFFIGCILWIWFGPEVSGRFALKREGDLTIRGVIALAAGVLVLLFLLPHAIHVLLRRPALEVGGGQLRIWMLPYETIPLAEISRIEVGDNSVDIFRHGKRHRRINTRILDEPRAFFFVEVKGQVSDATIVQEK